MSANDTQIGGDHYKKGGEEHWDRAWRLEYDCFQYIITKWIERWKDKGGVEDLKKARHAIDKYIEMVEKDESKVVALKAGLATCKCGQTYPWRHRALSRRDNETYLCPDCGTLEAMQDAGLEPGPGYVNQD